MLLPFFLHLAVHISYLAKACILFQYQLFVVLKFNNQLQDSDIVFSCKKKKKIFYANKFVFMIKKYFVK